VLELTPRSAAGSMSAPWSQGRMLRGHRLAPEGSRSAAATTTLFALPTSLDLLPRQPRYGPDDRRGGTRSSCRAPGYSRHGPGVSRAGATSPPVRIIAHRSPLSEIKSHQVRCARSALDLYPPSGQASAWLADARRLGLPVGIFGCCDRLQGTGERPPRVLCSRCPKLVRARLSTAGPSSYSTHLLRPREGACTRGS
jgi:hypothetical protein